MGPELFRLNFEVEPKHWWFVARRRIFREIISEVLSPSMGTTIVDVGCGTGGNIGALSGEYRCVGIDPSAEAIELARSRYPQVEFLRGEAPEGLGLVARQAKLFLVTDVLEHVPDDVGLLTRLVAAAAPGAYFLLTVPAEESLWSPHDAAHGHQRRYDREGFEALWRGLPLVPLMVSHFNARLYRLVKLRRAWSRWRDRSGVEAASDIRLPPPPVNRLFEQVFSGERKVLKDLLRGQRRRGYRLGVSLIALVRKPVSQVRPSEWLEDLGTDRREPAAEEIAAGHV